MVGVTERVCPVHAKSAFLCVTIQSMVPSRCSTVKEVRGDFVDINAVIGLVEVIFWYKKGIPRAALRNGSSMDNVDCAYVGISLIKYSISSTNSYELTFSAFPLTPTKVPLLVYSFCDADNETDKREYGAPKTSNRASTITNQISNLVYSIFKRAKYLQYLYTSQLSCSGYLHSTRATPRWPLR